MDAATFAKEIEFYVRPATFPLAVKMLAAEEPVPERAKRPRRDIQVEIVVCQAVAMARRYGWTLAVGREDINCALSSSFSGRLNCSDEINRTILTGDYQVILPCYGDRIFGHTEDREIAFALPASKTDELVAGLKGTQAGGIRYPIPTCLRYAPAYPESYDKLEQLWLESKKNV